MEILPNFLFEKLSQTLKKPFDMCVSNVPGSKFPLIYSGSQVYDIISLVNTGLVNSFDIISTYNNHLRFQVAIDKIVNINPDEIVSCIEESLEKVINEFKL